MLDLSTILNVVTMVLVALGGYALLLLRTGTEAAIKTSAVEAAKAAVEQVQWPKELARELQKTRGVERQELRFKSYGALWKELRPLAIYDPTIIDKKVVGDLSSKLSDWYFSDSGDLLLTPQARDFYFALQDLLRATSKSLEEWEADRSEEAAGGEREIFIHILRVKTTNATNGQVIDVLDYFKNSTFEDWQKEATSLGEKWRAGIKNVAANWKELNAKERFALLQQVGSILRSTLVNDLDSRLR